MLSAMIFLEPHNDSNAPLNIFPKTHKLGFIKHDPFINVNGLAKFMVPPKTLDKLKKKYGVTKIKANPGDVLLPRSVVHPTSSAKISSEVHATPSLNSSVCTAAGM